MFKVGQLIMIHPKLTNLRLEYYYNVTGDLVEDYDTNSYHMYTFLPKELRELAGTIHTIVACDEHLNTIKIRVDHSGTGCRYIPLIPDWVIPLTTFKEL